MKAAKGRFSEDTIMAYSVSKVDVWTAELDDRPGGLASKLEVLANAGVDLQFALARRDPLQPGKGVVFLSGLTGAKQTKAAASVGLKKATELAALRIDGGNKPGECYRAARCVADAGINLRGLMATTIGNKYALVLAFDSADDAAKASRLLKAGAKK
jgi:hypothetical protein